MGVDLIAKKGKTTIDLGRSYHFEDMLGEISHDKSRLAELQGKIDEARADIEKLAIPWPYLKDEKLGRIKEDLDSALDWLEEVITEYQKVILLRDLSDEGFTFEKV